MPAGELLVPAAAAVTQPDSVTPLRLRMKLCAAASMLFALAAASCSGFTRPRRVCLQWCTITLRAMRTMFM